MLPWLKLPRQWFPRHFCLEFMPTYQKAILLSSIPKTLASSQFSYTDIEITIFMSIQFGYLKIIFHLPIPSVYRSVSRLEFQQCDCSQPTSSFSVLSQHHRPSYCYIQPKLFKRLLSEPSLLTPKGPPSMD